MVAAAVTDLPAGSQLGASPTTTVRGVVRNTDDGWASIASPEPAPAYVLTRIVATSAAALDVAAFTDRSKSDGWVSKSKPEK